MSVFGANIQIIQQRWPKVALWLMAAAADSVAELVQNGQNDTLRIKGKLLGSRYDRQAEAVLQASLVPKKAEEAWVYGAGLGDLPCQLLKRKELRKLNVVIVEPSVMHAAMQAFDQSCWLEDERVELLTPAAVGNMKAPFTAVAAELLLAEEPVAARLRDQVLLEINTAYTNYKHRAGDGAIMQRLRENREFVATDGDVTSLFCGAQGCEAIVIGAGPTLEEALEWLPEKQRGRLVVAVDAALRLLLHIGVLPDVVVSIDASREGILSYFEALDRTLLEKIPLVYFPRVHADVLRNYPGPRLTAYSDSPVYDEIAQEYPKGTLFSSGSVIHPAVDLAVKIGAESIVLVGADFCFSANKHRAGDVRELDIQKYQYWVYDGRGEKVATFPNLKGYLRDLEHYIESNSAVRFYNHSVRGAQITGAEILDWNGK